MSTTLALRPRVLVPAVLLVLGAWVWRAELFSVQAPDEPIRPLAVLAPAARPPAPFDVTIPAVKSGAARLRSGDGVLIVQFWAPWERHGLVQATALDSLRKRPECFGVRPVLVTFDPFPSVARYVGRTRLGLEVAFDHHRSLREALPCSQLPTAYVIDEQGRIAAHVVGEIDWLAPESIWALRQLLAERDAEMVGPS